MKVYKLTYALLILVFATLGLTSGKNQQTRDPAKENEYHKQLQARNLRFPTTDYEEADLVDPKKNQARKEKKLRKNDFKLVARNPPFWQAERVVFNEGAWISQPFRSLEVHSSFWGELRRLKLTSLKTRRMSIQNLQS